MERQLAEAQKDTARLERGLKFLRAEKLDEDPEAWAIRCIADHNATIDDILDGWDAARVSGEESR